MIERSRKTAIYTILAALLLAVVAILFFAPDALEGRVLQQHDMTQGIANGQEGKAFTEATGETTRWTDSLFGGMPNFQISPSYTANSMLEWVGNLYRLWLPGPVGLLFSMMLGFFILALCMDFKWPTALFAAVAWGFSTYFIIIIGAGHIWKFLTLSYIPPTIGGLALIYRGRYLSGSALCALFGSLQLSSNHPQMSYYFLFVMLFLVVAWLVVAIRQKQTRRWGIATLCALGCGLLAVGVNSASLYNSYEYSKETVRGRSTELSAADGTAAAPGMSNDAITAWSYGIDETLTLLIPNVKGGASLKPVGGDNRIKSVLDTEVGSSAYLSPEEQQMAYSFTQYFGDQPMTNGPVYVGAFVLLLAIVAMFVTNGTWETPVKWALFASLIIAVFLSWGHNMAWFTNAMISWMPGYNKFRAVSSTLVVLEFCVPLLAAMCVMTIVRTPDFLKRYGTVFFTVFGLGALICLVGLISPSAFGSPFSVSEREQLASVMANPAYANLLDTIAQSRLSLVRADCGRSLIYIVLGFLICLAYMKGVFRNATLFACCLTAVVLIDLFSVNKRYVDSANFVTPAEAQTSLEPTQADRTILADKGNFRVFDVDGFGSARSSYFHKTIGGYHAAKLTRYEDLLKNQIAPADGRQPNQAVIDMLNARWFIIQGEAIPNPGALGNAWMVNGVDYVSGPDAEMRALDTLRPDSMAVADARFSNVLGKGAPVSPGDTIVETLYEPNHLKYRMRSARGGVAVFSEIYFPWGWKATIDGKDAEIGRVNYVLRALRVPAGEHEIEFRFDPESLRVTNGISVACLIAVYAVCLCAIVWAGVSISRRRKRS